MKLSAKNKSFEPCPEYNGPAVCVDVTIPKRVESQYGPKEVFRVVFETKLLREDGTPYCVWSRGFTPSLHEKSAFSQFLRKWNGRALTAAEEEEFDTESLIGKTAEITVVHEDGRNGEVYANIALIRPDRSSKRLLPTGKYIRMKDREKEQSGSDSEYRRVDSSEDSNSNSEADWRKTKVHVGTNKGMELADLDRKSVQALIDRWLPTVKAAAKTSADDKRLMAALDAANAELNGDDQIPMDAEPF